jgi:hypothetical protein
MTDATRISSLPPRTTRARSARVTRELETRWRTGLVGETTATGAASTTMAIRIINAFDDDVVG